MPLLLGGLEPVQEGAQQDPRSPRACRRRPGRQLSGGAGLALSTVSASWTSDTGFVFNQRSDGLDRAGCGKEQGGPAGRRPGPELPCGAVCRARLRCSGWTRAWNVASPSVSPCTHRAPLSLGSCPQAPPPQPPACHSPAPTPRLHRRGISVGPACEPPSVVAGSARSSERSGLRRGTNNTIFLQRKALNTLRPHLRNGPRGNKACGGHCLHPAPPSPPTPTHPPGTFSRRRNWPVVQTSRAPVRPSWTPRRRARRRLKGCELPGERGAQRLAVCRLPRPA